jgi:hypothetical protein
MDHHLFEEPASTSSDDALGRCAALWADAGKGRMHPQNPSTF